jgi:phosphoribosylformylglycinamidine synthase
MAGSRLPVVVSHGEGRAEFADPGQQGKVTVAMRYIDNRGAVATRYPSIPTDHPTAWPA